MLGRKSDNGAATIVHTLDDDFDLHALHRQAPMRYPFLLQSTASESNLGRFDILFACPGDALILSEIGQLEGAAEQRDFLVALDDNWRKEATCAIDAAVPFTGGWFLYLGYELAAEIEPRLTAATDPVLPVAFAVRCKAAVIKDRLSGKQYLMQEQDAVLETDELASDIRECMRTPTAPAEVPHDRPKAIEEPPGQFLDAVVKAQEFIAAGDIYQANLSRGWSASADEILDTDRIYAALSNANPAPFAGLVRWQDATIISSSPERLLAIRDGVISTRPIAGTRPRSEDKATDDSLSAELFSHPKEIAEHVMLIDLERNDLGRVCEPGSVEVDEMMVLESYAHVHHIVSNVRGVLRADVTPGDAIRAVFPGGTITGCPKVRCMEIIHELENGPRGAYTGSFGYLNRDGSLDLNILIRTMVVRDNTITFRAGSGIVADSEAQAELAETRAKAKGLLRALST